MEPNFCHARKAFAVAGDAHNAMQITVGTRGDCSNEDCNGTILLAGVAALALVAGIELGLGTGTIQGSCGWRAGKASPQAATQPMKKGADAGCWRVRPQTSALKTGQGTQPARAAQSESKGTTAENRRTRRQSSSKQGMTAEGYRRSTLRTPAATGTPARPTARENSDRPRTTSTRSANVEERSAEHTERGRLAANRSPRSSGGQHGSQLHDQPRASAKALARGCRATPRASTCKLSEATAHDEFAKPSSTRAAHRSVGHVDFDVSGRHGHPARPDPRGAGAGDAGPRSSRGGAAFSTSCTKTTSSSSIRAT